ncbi:MAG: B-box zinc finger protein [Anaerolineales bacterium]|nr:B-box zinc finger protein [Anaerolineales bacterium]
MTDSPPKTYCVNHPQTETSLRCNKCEKPICVKCAVLTPTGYRCKECVKGQQKQFETALWYDYIIAFMISSILSYVGSRIITIMSYFTILLAPVAGVIIAELIRTLTKRRRSKRLFQLTTLATVLGSLPILIMYLFMVISGLSQGGFGLLWNLLWQGVYTFTVTSTVYYRMSGIKIG